MQCHLWDRSSPASAGSISDSSEPDSPSHGNARATDSADACSLAIGPECPATPMSTRSEWPTPVVRDRETLAKVTRGAHASAGGTPLLVAIINSPDPSMCSSADSPAKTSPMPESGSVSWTGPIPPSGSNSNDVLASFDRASSSWKTCQGSLFGASMTSSVDWPREGMTRSGHLYAQPMLVHHTNAVAFSSSRIPLWPTPQTTDGASAARHTTTTGVMHPGTTLTDAVRSSTWMTPQSRDHKGISQKVARGKYNGGLPDQLAGLHDRENTPTRGNRRGPSRPVLNPRWVACLMGFPVTWLDGIEPPSRPSATPSSPPSRKSSLNASSLF